MYGFVADTVVQIYTKLDGSHGCESPQISARYTTIDQRLSQHRCPRREINFSVKFLQHQHSCF